MQSKLRKEEIYKKVYLQLESLFSSHHHAVMRMSTVSCVLKHSFASFYWVGFYLWDKNLDRLVIGPYQGTLGCLEISLGKGVCGSSLEQNKTLIVPNVHEFSNHIACDAKTNSEIVIPLSFENQPLGVLDVDSLLFNSFDQVDQQNLEKICGEFITPFLPI